MEFMQPEGEILLVTDGDMTEVNWEYYRIDRGEGVNLSRWYNLGLQNARLLGYRFVLYCESDVRIEWSDVEVMRTALEVENLSMVGPDFYNRGQYAVRRRRGAVPIWDRITQCFLVRPGIHAEMDEDYRWWFEADDLEWRMRELNGTRLVKALTSFHPFTGTTQLSGDDDRAEAIAAGRAKFLKTWGTLPF